MINFEVIYLLQLRRKGRNKIAKKSVLITDKIRKTNPDVTVVISFA